MNFLFDLMPVVRSFSNVIFIFLLITLTCVSVFFILFELTSFISNRTASTFIERDKERILLIIKNTSIRPVSVHLPSGKMVILGRGDKVDIARPSHQIRIDYPASLFFRTKKISITTLNRDEV